MSRGEFAEAAKLVSLRFDRVAADATGAAKANLVKAIQNEVQILRGALPGFTFDASDVAMRRGDLLGDAVSSVEDLPEF